MTFSANAWALTLRTEKITFCPGSRTRRFLTSDRMKGTFGTVRAINNSESLHVNFLHHSSHFVGSHRATLFSFSISLGPWLGKRLLYSLFFPGSRPLLARLPYQ